MREYFVDMDGMQLICVSGGHHGSMLTNLREGATFAIERELMPQLILDSNVEEVEYKFSPRTACKYYYLIKTKNGRYKLRKCKKRQAQVKAYYPYKTTKGAHRLCVLLCDIHILEKWGVDLWEQEKYHM